MVEEARAYSSYAKKKVVDVEDVKLAIKMIADKNYSTVPPREVKLATTTVLVKTLRYICSF